MSRGSPHPSASPPARIKRKVRRPHRVLRLLDRSQLDELEKFASKPGRSVDECWEWMRAKGKRIARSSVGRWLGAFLATDHVARSPSGSATIGGGASAGGVMSYQLIVPGDAIVIVIPKGALR